MFIGHYGIALALKRADPKVSLGTLFVAVQLVDILWAVFILLGWERARIEPGLTPGTPLQFLHYPWSHSLGAAFIWGLAAAAAMYSWPRKDTSHRLRAALVIGVAVASHWFLDLAVHVRDLPLWSDASRKFGFGLWDNPTVALLLELALLVVGGALYATHRSRRHPLRPARLAILGVVLVLVGLASQTGGAPPSMRTVAIVALAAYLGLAALASWEDRPAPAPAPSKGRRR